MGAIVIQPGKAHWRSRDVKYYRADWESVLNLMPEFDLVPFSAGDDEPENPFLQAVRRKPLSSAERPMNLGVVSHSYSLAGHRQVATLCRQGLIDAGIDGESLSFEVGLSELGEWMNLRIYLGERYCFDDKYGKKLDLRLECFNSVDGSSRLMIVFGWLRFVCTNGLIIGETKIEINERHDHKLQLRSIPERIRPAIEVIQLDRSRMTLWQNQKIDVAEVGYWADGKLSSRWGKKAAARVFHICASGKDIEIVDQFTPGSATEKCVRYLERVPGSPEQASSKYDVLQAMSFVASQRSNTEERVAWQAEIPTLLQHLGKQQSPSKI